MGRLVLALALLAALAAVLWLVLVSPRGGRDVAGIAPANPASDAATGLVSAAAPARSDGNAGKTAVSGTGVDPRPANLPGSGCQLLLTLRTDPAGCELRDPTVHCFDAHGGYHPLRARGPDRFVGMRLLPGEYRIRVDAQSCQPVWRRIRIDPEETEKSLSELLRCESREPERREPEKRWIRVRWQSTDGTPIAVAIEECGLGDAGMQLSVQIRGADGSVQSERSGFRFTDREVFWRGAEPDWPDRPADAFTQFGVPVDAGELTLEAKFGRYVSQSLHVDPAQDEVVLRSAACELARSLASLRVRLRRADGSLVSQVSVSLVDPGGDPIRMFGSEGAFHAGRLSPGRYRLVANTFRGETQFELDLAPGEDREMELSHPKLGADCRIRVLVVDESGAPADNVAVVVTRRGALTRSNRAPSLYATGRDGTVEIPDPPVEECEVRVAQPFEEHGPQTVGPCSEGPRTVRLVSSATTAVHFDFGFDERTTGNYVLRRAGRDDESTGLIPSSGLLTTRLPTGDYEIDREPFGAPLRFSVGAWPERIRVP